MSTRGGWEKGMLDASEIAKTFDLIRPYLRRTPVVRVGGAEFGVEAETIALKLEQLQHAGSFKTRGAFANLILREVPP